MTMTADELREALELEFDVTDYSGRGMMGARCIGCCIDDLADLFLVGRALAEHDIGKPKIDNMGLGYIIYWPRIKLIDDDATSLTT